MDFRFLFDAQRQLFHIGYNVTAEKLDNNYYDLLASEARIASIVTIARNEVPPSHWLHLGRPLTQVDGTRALLSWGGTMFEYLMPALMMRNYEGTLLQHSCLAAVDAPNRLRQTARTCRGAFPNRATMRLTRIRIINIAPLACPAWDSSGTWTEDLVVAPYASLLALSLRPRQVMENIARLDKLQMLGTYGFYESIDFSPTATSRSAKRMPSCVRIWRITRG